MNAGLTSPFKGVFAGIFGFFYAPLVITGLHHMSNAIDLQLIADFGGTTLWPMIAPVSYTHLQDCVKNGGDIGDNFQAWRNITGRFSEDNRISKDQRV